MWWDPFWAIFSQTHLVTLLLSQSYDFGFYSHNASVVVGGRFFISEKNILSLKTR
jgi:hypothetical protein